MAVTRGAWSKGGTALTDTATYTTSKSYDAASEVWLARLTIKKGSATAATKSEYKFTMDGLTAYAASSTLDVASTLLNTYLDVMTSLPHSNHTSPQPSPTHPPLLTWSWEPPSSSPSS